MDAKDLCKSIVVQVHAKAYSAVWDYFAIPKWYVAADYMEHDFSLTHLINLNYRRPPEINISDLLEEITGF